MNSLQQLEADAEIGKKRLAVYVDCVSVVNLNALMAPRITGIPMETI